MGHGMLIWHPQTHVHPGKRAVLAVQHAEGCNACPLSRKYVVCVCARVHARAPARRVCAHRSGAGCTGSVGGVQVRWGLWVAAAAKIPSKQGRAARPSCQVWLHTQVEMARVLAW
eukprot:scaffold270757_cov22-Tisochrysis_lutea.AAC.1